MKKGKQILVIRNIRSLLTIVLASLVIFLCILAFFHSFRWLWSGEENEKEDIYEYQYFELNTQLNKTSFGLLSLYEYLGENEFLSYRNEEGDGSSYILISNFESKEYVCTGFCYCTNNDDGIRRRSATLLSEGMIYLLAATSSLVAFKYAKDYFQDQCSKEMSCEEEGDSKIESEVDDCVSVENNEPKGKPFDDVEFKDGHFIDVFGTRIPEEYFDEETHVQKEKYKKEYLCSGVCLPRLFSDSYAKKIAFDYRCYDMKMEGEITMYFKDTIFHHTYTRRRLFQQEHLEPFCRKNSRRIDEVPGWLSFKLEEDEVGSHLCVSGHAGLPNPTVNCRFVLDPEMKEKFGITEWNVDKLEEELSIGMTNSDIHPFDVEELDIEKLREIWNAPEVYDDEDIKD